MQNIITKLLENAASKKLWVFIGATALLLNGTIAQDTWVMITLGYLGAQGATDFASVNKPKERTPRIVPNVDQVI